MKSIISLFLLYPILSIGNAQFNLPGGGGSPGGGGGNPLSGGGVPAVPTGVPAAVPTGMPNLPTGMPNLDISDICNIFTVVPNPQLKPDLVSGVCQMAKNWLKNIKNIGKQPPSYRDILSANQTKYWDTVTSCHSIQCLCDYWPKCKQFTQELSNGTRPVNTTEILYYSTRYGSSIRKELRAMTEVERRRFFYAFNKLKNDKIDGWSKFDILTGYHFFVPFTPAAHFSAGVLPFHRELVKNLEIAMRMEHPLASFPYWDTTLDAEMNNPKDTVFWTDELMGSGDGNTTNGPFGWFTGNSNPNFPGTLPLGPISRAFGLSQKGVLFNKEYLQVLMAFPDIQAWVFCYNPFFDTVHAGIHLYVGGMMADPSSSPGDPTFYLLHAFLDQVWEMWRLKHQTRDQRSSQIALPCPYNPFDISESPLFPFINVKVRDGYSNIYTDEFYQYQEMPGCSNKCHDSPFLVCNQKSGRCQSRVRKGGDCSGLDFDPCYNSKCQSGLCQ